MKKFIEKVKLMSFKNKIGKTYYKIDNDTITYYIIKGINITEYESQSGILVDRIRICKGDSHWHKEATFTIDAIIHIAAMEDVKEVPRSIVHPTGGYIINDYINEIKKIEQLIFNSLMHIK